jgi:hypothetical protein
VSENIVASQISPPYVPENAYGMRDLNFGLINEHVPTSFLKENHRLHLYLKNVRNNLMICELKKTTMTIRDRINMNNFDTIAFVDVDKAAEGWTGNNIFHAVKDQVKKGLSLFG